MLENIESAFRRFDESLRAPADERERLIRQRDRAADALAAEPRVLRVIDAGSYRHHTEVGGSSWFDVLVVLSGKPAGAAKAAELVSNALGAGALGSNALVSGALGAAPIRWAVGVPAEGEPPGIRIIPAFEAPASVSAAGGDVVLVADAAKRWVALRVGARETLLNRIGDEGLRPLIRLVLAWKHRVNASISSYYLETAVVRQALQQPSFSVLWDLCWIFEQLAADDLMTLSDVSSPLPKQGVRAASSLARRLEAGYLIDAAAAHLRAAVNASIDDDDEVVEQRLRAVFGAGFPGL